jgi:glyoxylase-like metal-dependent hydrolase (beta-lactamase superfamily II)
MTPVLEVFTVPPFQENTYLLGDSSTGDAVVIDAGGRTEDIMRVAEQRGLTIRYLLNTHAHIDHVSGVAELRRVTGAPFLLHSDAVAMLSELPSQAAMFGLPQSEAPEIDGAIDDGAEFQIGGITLTAHDTAGHAPGHVTFVGSPIQLDGEETPFALVGDLIFLGSIGRVDLPGGDYATLMSSIERVILPLSDETLLLSGHGPATTVGYERAYNPYVRDWLQRGGIQGAQ